MSPALVRACSRGLLGLIALAGLTIVAFDACSLSAKVYIACTALLFCGAIWSTKKAETAEQTDLQNRNMSLVWQNYNLRRFIRSWVLLLREASKKPPTEQPTLTELAAAYDNAMQGWTADTPDDQKLREFALKAVAAVHARRQSARR